ncbi:hypothetical protein [Paramesorhizobium deserti]|nr:hypothetical protein [Paramesorhizobium deserti]
MSATASSTNHFGASRMPFPANRQFPKIILESRIDQLFGMLGDKLPQD